MHQDIKLTQNEAGIIHALRFFSEDVKGHSWRVTDNLKNEAAEKTSFLPESLGIELTLVGGVIYAMNALPQQTVDLKVEYASTYSSRVDGLIYPNWHVAASTNGGSRSAKLSFFVTDDIEICLDGKGFATASGIHNFIAQTQSTKKNSGKRIIVNSIIEVARPRWGDIPGATKDFLEPIIARLQADPEAPQNFGYVLPFFRNQ